MVPDAGWAGSIPVLAANLLNLAGAYADPCENDAGARSEHPSGSGVTVGARLGGECS